MSVLPGMMFVKLRRVVSVCFRNSSMMIGEGVNSFWGLF